MSMLLLLPFTRYKQWRRKQKLASAWGNKSKNLVPQYITFQNGDFIALQNGDLLKTHDAIQEWTYKTKQLSI